MLHMRVKWELTEKDNKNERMITSLCLPYVLFHLLADISEIMFIDQCFEKCPKNKP